MSAILKTLSNDWSLLILALFLLRLSVIWGSEASLLSHKQNTYLFALQNNAKIVKSKNI